MRLRHAFTLVELLVVTGVIALLIAILLPAASRARESANRAACAANLHNLGVAAVAFAAENRGLFPTAYRLPGDAHNFRFPAVLSRDGALDCTGNKWKTHGVPAQTFERYGMPRKSWRCPSADYADVRELTPGDAASPAPDEWGPVLWTHYAYVAGLTVSSKGRSIAHWGAAEPAVRLGERGGASKVLATDMVFYSGGDGKQWDATAPRYMINHRRADTPLPAAQNVLYADGHVETLGRDHYTAPLNTTDNYSLLHAATDVGGYFYWGPTQAAPPPVPPIVIKHIPLPLPNLPAPKWPAPIALQ
jgi:prepilin-type N-terminal cleavage/methylation domain-containing protein